MMIEKDQGIRTYRKALVKKRKIIIRSEPPIQIENINGWYLKKKFDHIHYYYKALKPLCNHSNYEELEKLLPANEFSLKHRKCRHCLTILKTYSDLSLRGLD